MCRQNFWFVFTEFIVVPDMQLEISVGNPPTILFCSQSFQATLWWGWHQDASFV